MCSADIKTDLEVPATEQAFVEHKRLAYKTWLGELDVSIPARSH